MPQYYGSGKDPVAPLVSAPEMKHTPQQIDEWWNTLATGAREDFWISRDLNQEPHVLYVLNERGVLPPCCPQGREHRR